MDRVSVVIVAFNSSSHIAQCLRALRESDVPVDLIVVDNDSEDETVEVVEKELAAFDVAQLLRSESNVGFARGVNIGLRRALGRYAVVLNPDCYVGPSTLRVMMATMRSRPDVGLAGCLLLNEDGSEQAGCRRYIPTPWRALMRVLHLKRLFRGRHRFNDFIMSREPLPAGPIEVEALSGALMMVRLESLQSVGMLDEAYFMHCEDLDWCVRFRNAGWRVLFMPNAKAVHVKGASSVSRPMRVEYHKHAGMIRFYRLHLRKRYGGALMWAVVASVWARFLGKAIVTAPNSARIFLQKRRANRTRHVSLEEIGVKH